MKKGDALVVNGVDIEVESLQGGTVNMPSLWSDRTVLLVFLRHFG